MQEGYLRLYFRVEYSIDGLSFDTTGFVSGSGNSDEIKEYSFIDKRNFSMNSYYRLAQVDFDNKVTYSNVIELINEEESGVTIYPNPFYSSFKLQAHSLQFNNGIIKNLNGATLENFTISSINPVELGNAYPPGIYFISLFSDQESIVVKVIKK